MHPKTTLEKFTFNVYKTQTLNLLKFSSCIFDKYHLCIYMQHTQTCQHIHAIYTEMSHNIQYTNNIDYTNYIKNISTTKSYMKYILTAVGIYCGPGLIFYSHFKVFVKSHGEELYKSGQRESFFYHFQLSRIRKLFPMQSKQ